MGGASRRLRVVDNDMVNLPDHLPVHAEAMAHSSYQIVTIPTANPLTPLELRVAVYSEMMLKLTLRDAMGSLIWDCQLPFDPRPVGGE